MQPSYKRYDSFSSADISMDELPDIPRRVALPKKAQPGSFNVSNRRKRFIKIAEETVYHQVYHDVGDMNCDDVLVEMAITMDQLRLIYPTPDIVLKTKKYKNGIFGRDLDSYNFIKDLFLKDNFQAQSNDQSFLQSVRYDFDRTYSSNDRRIPYRIRRHVLPNLDLDFESINTIISVGNSMYCGKCTSFRHRKIYQYLERSTIDMGIFSPTIYTHIDTCIHEDLRLTRKVLRKHASYLPQTAARVKHELQLMRASERKTAKQKTKARGRERQNKFDRHEFEAQIGNFGVNVSSPELNRLTDAIENFKFKLGDAESSQLNSLISSLTSVTKLFNEKGSSIASQLISYIVGFITFIAQLKNARTTEECVLAFTAFFSRFVNVIDTCCSNFVALTKQSSEWIREKINPTIFHEAQAPEEEFEAQSDEGGIVGMLNYFADALYTIVGIPKELFSYLRPHVSLIRDLSMLVTGVERLVTFFFKYIDLLFGKITSYFNPQEEDCDIVDYIVEVQEFLNPDSINILKRDDMPSVVRKMADLYNRGLCINSSTLLKADAAKKASFSRIFTMVCSMLKTVSPYYFTDALRISPYIICLRGPSGVGKSHLNEFLPRALYSHPAVNVPVGEGSTRTEYKPGQDVYVRNFTEDYWDGYRNQRVVIFDDFLQMREEKQTIESLNELIKVSNNNPYPLNMASIEEKGCVRFTSDMVIITTNRKFTENELRAFVTSPTAIQRRIHVNIEVTLDPKFRKADGTYKSEDDKFHPEAWRFTCDPNSDQSSFDPLGRSSMNLADLVDVLAYKFLSHRAKDQEMINAADQACTFENLNKACNPEEESDEEFDFQIDSGLIDDREVMRSMQTTRDQFDAGESHAEFIADSLREDVPPIIKKFSKEQVIDYVLTKFQERRLYELIGLTPKEVNKEKDIPWKQTRVGKRTKALLVACHPDKIPETTPELKEKAREAFDVLNWLVLFFNCPEAMRLNLSDELLRYEHGTANPPTRPVLKYTQLNPTGGRRELFNERDTSIINLFGRTFDEKIYHYGGEHAEFHDAESFQRLDNTNFEDFYLYGKLNYMNIWRYFCPEIKIYKGCHNYHGYLFATLGADKFTQYIKATMLYYSLACGQLLGILRSDFEHSPVTYVLAAIQSAYHKFKHKYNGSLIEFLKNCDASMFLTGLENVAVAAWDMSKSILNSMMTFYRGLLASINTVTVRLIYKYYDRNGYAAIADVLMSYLGLGATILSFIGIFKLIFGIIDVAYSYFGSKKEEEMDTESYTQKDHVKCKHCLCSESYAQKDHVKDRNTLRSESYAQKDHVKGKHILLSESFDAEGKMALNDIMGMKHFRSQMAEDKNAYDLVTGKVRNNLVRVTYGNSSINGLFVKGRCLLVNRHLLTSMRYANTTQCCIEGNGNAKINVPDIFKLVYFEDPDKDVAIIELNKIQSSEHVDITSHFYKDHEVSKNLGAIENGSLPAYTNNLDRADLWLKQVGHIRTHGPLFVNHTMVGQRYQIVKGWLYQSQTVAGDCGAPLIAHCTGLTSKILGIHAAGTSGKGFATSITYDYLISHLPKTAISVVIPDGLEVQISEMIYPTDKVSFFGQVPPEFTYRAPTETKVTRSILFDELSQIPEFTPKKCPAILKPRKKPDGSTFYPMRAQIEKQFIPPIVFPEQDVEEAYINLRDKIKSMKSNYTDDRVLLTEDINLNGVPGNEHLPPLNHKTAPGYPWNFHVGTRGKRDLLVGEPGSFKLRDDIREYLSEIEKEFLDRKIRPFLWADCMKDEKLPIEKVEAGKVRVFNVSPFELLYLTRKYFGVFIAHLSANKLGEVSVGVNVHSEDWSNIREDLLKHSRDAEGNKRERYLMCGDYSNYDKRLPYTLISKVCQIINEWYDDGEDNALIRECLFIATFNAFHIAGRSVYRVLQGNPSGCAITAQINSLVNSMYARIVYAGLGREQTPPVSLASFSDDIVYKSYGDDNIASVSVNCPWYNMISFSEYLGRYGITYTSVSKDDILYPYANWEETSYLKRKFVVDNGYTYAPLDMDSISEMLLWKKNTNLCDEDIIKSTFQSFQIELAHYPHETFSKYTDFVQRVFASKKLDISSQSWSHLRLLMTTGQIPIL